jgi:prevent-host-death family protein
MSAVSVRELKNHLGEHLRRVQGGERIMVTDHGRPIAKITPLCDEAISLCDEAISLDERLAQMAEAGEVILPNSTKKPRKNARPALVRGRPGAETLLEDRR